MDSVHFMSRSNEWRTPQKTFSDLDSEFNFVFDAACTSENCLCKDGFMVDGGCDALISDWPKNGYIWLNPPYGRQLGKWIKKVHEEWKKGCKIVCLIPARTDTSYWHEYIFDQAKIRFLRGRLYFSEGGRAPFPSAVIIFD